MPAQHEGPLILIVEDNADEATIAAILLAHAGYATRLARSVDGALETLQQIVPDLILLDLHMPEKSGIDLLEEIERSPRDTQIPVLVYTAYPDVYGTELGRFSVDVLRKPYSPRELLDAITQGLRLRMRRSAS